MVLRWLPTGNKDIFEYLYNDDPHNRRIIRVIGTVYQKIDQNEIKTSLRTVFENIITEYRKVFVLTDGTNYGVSRLVGELFDEHFSENENIKLIGVNLLQNVLSENDWQQIQNLEVPHFYF